MAFKGLLITETGKAILAQAHLGSGLCITRVMIGDGSVNKDHEDVESMINGLYSKNPALHRDGDKVFIDVDITSNDMSGYYFREIGIFAKDSANKEVLFAYDNAGDDAEYIAPVDSNIAYEKRLHFVFVISNNIKVTISTAGTIYALQDDLETLDKKKLDKTGSAGETTVTYLTASKRDNIKSGETLSIILGKIAKWFGDFKSIVWTGSYKDLVDVPKEFPPESHIHDDLYYRKSVLDSHKNDTVSHVTQADKNIWNDRYTKNEVDNKLSALETKIDWKEAVATFTDIAKTYPNPQDGWTVNVKDTDYTYRWSGTAWVAISANAIPKATQSVDGLLSKEDKKKLDDNSSSRHTHSNKSVLDKIDQGMLDTILYFTDTEVTE